MKMRRSFLIIILFGLIGLSPFSVVASDGDKTEQVNRVLKKMSTAVRELNYRGLFTYEVGGALDTYKIVHKVKAGEEHERLRKLNGSEREVLRKGHTIDCLSRGDQLLRGVLRSSGPPSDLRNNYDFYVTGNERVADRAALVVQIVPKDQHRFGYTLAIDRKTGLPLKAMRVSTQDRIMERIQFVELSVGEHISDEEVQPDSGAHEQAASDQMNCSSPVKKEEAAWRAEWLPEGFMYSGQREISNGDHMLTYTDGLATFSVFIGGAGSRPAIAGRAQIGATVAYVNQRVWNGEPHSVTVVGEIPFATAQQVVAGLEPSQ